MRVVVSGGGTGGHVYPALAVLEALRQPPFDLRPEDVRYLGVAGRAEEELVPRAGYPFHPVAAGPVLGRNPRVLAGSAVRILQGTFQAAAVMRQFRPQAVFATGGYVSVPVVLAAWCQRIPSLVYLPDAEPGLAVRFLSRLATLTAVTALPKRSRLPAGRVVVTGYPVRSGFGACTRTEGRARWSLDMELPALLIWGGSQGAHRVNRVIAERLLELLETCQIVHVSGHDDGGWLQEHAQALPKHLRGRYTVRPYVFEGVPELMAAVDLIVSRAGASILGELPTSRLPAILVPYPHAGAHQVSNAGYLVDAGAAVLVTEDRLDELVPTVHSLLRDRARLADMRQRAAALARPNAAQQIASLLAGIAAGPQQRPGEVLSGHSGRTG